MIEFGDRRLPDRFWSKVQVDDSGCWLWTASRYGNGYSQWHGANAATGHRDAYIALVGPVPTDLVMDHLCRVRHCVNPDHLEPVPHAVNVRRGDVVRAMRARKAAMTHCEAGHPFTGDNLYINKTTGGRVCRECRRGYDRARRARERDAAKEAAA